MSGTGKQNLRVRLCKLSELVLIFFVISNYGFAQTDVVSNNIEFQQHFDECFAPPKETMGQHFTIRFSIKNDGSIIGHPSIFWFTLQNDPKHRATLEPLIINAMQKCFPVPLGEPLKDMVPGKVHVLEFNLTNQIMHIQD